MKIYGIKDVGSGFTQIVTQNSDYNAIRFMREMVNSRQPSIVTQYPKDFSLYRLGELDQDSGMLTPEKKAVFITEAVSLKQEPEQVKEQA